jgi:hypothetical protein
VLRGGKLEGRSFLLLFSVAVLCGAPPAAAQSDLDAMVTRCVGGYGPDDLALLDPAAVATCQEGALLFQGLTGGLGLLMTGGTDLPGNGSSLGWRMPRSPRTVVFSRLKGSHLGVPDVVGAPAGSGGEESFLAAGLETGFAVGAFNGFSLAPTVGGVLALDLLGSIQWNLLPENPGFDGNTWSWSVGGRLGVIRESFSIPGITVSARYASMGRAEYGSDAASSTLDLSGTSLRAVIGKEFMALGVLLGVGWDQYESDGGFTVVLPPPGSDRTISADGFSIDRTVGFGQVTFTYLVLQLSLEGGWAWGLDTLSSPYEGRYDPTAGGPHGSFSARVTF